MKFKHLIEKMQKCQNRIDEHIADQENPVTIPDDLSLKMNEAQVWLDEVNPDLGFAEVPDKAPDIDVMSEYSNKLYEYKDIFDKKVQSEIAEMRELIEVLFNKVKEPDIDDC